MGVETTLRVQPRCQKTARAPADGSTTYCTPALFQHHRPS